MATPYTFIISDLRVTAPYVPLNASEEYRDSFSAQMPQEISFLFRNRGKEIFVSLQVMETNAHCIENREYILYNVFLGDQVDQLENTGHISRRLEHIHTPSSLSQKALVAEEFYPFQNLDPEKNPYSGLDLGDGIFLTLTAVIREKIKGIQLWAVRDASDAMEKSLLKEAFGVIEDNRHCVPGYEFVFSGEEVGASLFALRKQGNFIEEVA